EHGLGKKTLRKCLESNLDYITLKIENFIASSPKPVAKRKIMSFFKFLKTVFSFTEIVIYVDQLETTFSKNWVSEVRKEMKRALSEMETLEILIKQKKLWFKPGFGMYEFQGIKTDGNEKDAGFWKLIPEEYVKNDVINILKKQSTASKVNAVFMLVKNSKAREQYLPPFDYLNLQNGILNIHTREMVDATGTYNINHILPYKYLEGKKSALWEDTVAIFSCDIIAIQLLLSQIYGYCLTTDNKYEKIFMLMGEGSNGKTTYIET
ncbi:unnamed protein product, partial [marine sediment metagenome]